MIKSSMHNQLYERSTHNIHVRYVCNVVAIYPDQYFRYIVEKWV